ncbi:MAG: hypothetical protein CSA65_08380 [Proteobacteria bacterium]|nr:MAG: hypothetical protein CSA65_08380 [Pseudomonadota bacterium]
MGKLLSFVGLVGIVGVLGGGCQRRADRPPAEAKRKAAVSSRPAKPVPPPQARIDSHWDPKTGRGDVRQYFADGSVIRTCFHCRYKGYTGGLVIGNLSGSGSALYPKRPIRGFRRINIFCAQDESIWDRKERAEYSYGWSENFPPKDGGKRLRYRRGRVLEQSATRLVLQSENAGGCYKVTKVAHSERGARWWIIATRVTNRCSHPIDFDLYTGDDPWLGTYKSSDGDVGWTPAGIIRHETALGPGAFTVGGFYDLGNSAVGQRAQRFSNQANFIALDPATPLPDGAYFANRFAHDEREVDPKKALHNKTLTALNLAWKGRRLASGEGFTFAFALGLAQTSTPGATPRAPMIGVKQWSVWRRYLKEGKRGRASSRPEFAAERVVLTLGDRAVNIEGTYYLRNRSQDALSVRVAYPILHGKHRPPPRVVRVDGRDHPVRVVDGKHAEATLQLQIAPRALQRFVIRYRQRHTRRKAAYMVTSARRWPTPITRAKFVVRAPTRLGRLKTSFAPTRREIRGDQQVVTIVRHDFWPDHELVVRW